MRKHCWQAVGGASGAGVGGFGLGGVGDGGFGLGGVGAGGFGLGGVGDGPGLGPFSI